jgi:hypothetical protein
VIKTCFMKCQVLVVKSHFCWVIKTQFLVCYIVPSLFLGGEYPRSALTKSSVHDPRSTWPACRANGGTKNSWMVYSLQWKIHCKLIVWMVWMCHKWIWMIWMYPQETSKSPHMTLWKGQATSKAMVTSIGVGKYQTASWIPYGYPAYINQIRSGWISSYPPAIEHG